MNPLFAGLFGLGGPEMIALLVIALAVGGFFRSLQFTSINTLGYADIDRQRMSRAIVFLVDQVQDVNIIRPLLAMARLETAAEVMVLASAMFATRDATGLWQMELREACGRRWFLAGNDYVWPHAVHRAARRVIAREGGRIVGPVKNLRYTQSYLDALAACRSTSVVMMRAAR